MLVEAIMVAVGAVGTAAVGIPIAVRMARAQLPGSTTRAAGHEFSPPREAGIAGFTPLDLGEDPTQWPSATPWPSSAMPLPDWPSKLWNDDHFGRHWDKIQDGVEPGRARKDADEIGRPAPSPPPQAKKPRQKTPSPAPRAQEQREAQHRARAESKQREAAKQALARKQEQRAAPPPPSSAPAPQLEAPGRDELLRLVDSVGLAGTVQEIMGRTGWDFRKAAQYLAKVRAGG